MDSLKVFFVYVAVAIVVVPIFDIYGRCMVRIQQLPYWIKETVYVMLKIMLVCFFGAVIYVPNVVILGGFDEDDGARIFSVIVSVISTFPGVIYYVKRYGHKVK